MPIANMAVLGPQKVKNKLFLKQVHNKSEHTFVWIYSIIIKKT